MVKIIEDQETGKSVKNQYVVVMFEKILEELTEIQFGYFRVTVKMKNVDCQRLNIDDKINFYFWVNVSGICTMADKNNKVSPIFEPYKYVEIKEKQ